MAALAGVGDPRLGEWIDDGLGNGIVHVQRRLTSEEQAVFGVPEPFDIRGTEEQRRRIAVVFAEAPWLRGRFDGHDGHGSRSSGFVRERTVGGDVA